MKRDVQTILKLRVPVIVRLGERRLPLHDVLGLGPGAIIELPKSAEKPLDLMVNNKVIGDGTAVKLGENFGIRVGTIGDHKQRLDALAGESVAEATDNDPVNGDEVESEADATAASDDDQAEPTQPHT